jgi:hypothetical protein
VRHAESICLPVETSTSPADIKARLSTIERLQQRSVSKSFDVESLEGDYSRTKAAFDELEAKLLTVLLDSQ